MNVDSAPFVVPTDSGALLVEVGTSAGAVIRGRLHLRGAARIVDCLNNWSEPAVALTQATPLSGGRAPVAILLRREMLWVRGLEAEPVRRSGDAWVQKEPHSVLVHVGPYEIRGTAFTFPRARWVDFLEALGERFFPLTAVQITWGGHTLDAPFLTVNAGRVAALLALEDR